MNEGLEKMIEEFQRDFFPMQNKTMLRYVIVKAWEASREEAKKDVLEFMKREQATAECERKHGKVQHCSCLDFVLNEILCQHKEKKLDYCPQCNEIL